MAIVSEPREPCRSVANFTTSGLQWGGVVVIGFAVLEWFLHAATTNVHRDLELARRCSVVAKTRHAYSHYIDYRIVESSWFRAHLPLRNGRLPTEPNFVPVAGRLAGRLCVCAVLAASIIELGYAWVHSVGILNIARLVRLKHAVCGIPRAADLPRVVIVSCSILFVRGSSLRCDSGLWLGMTCWTQCSLRRANLNY